MRAKARARAPVDATRLTSGLLRVAADPSFIMYAAETDVVDKAALDLDGMWKSRQPILVLRELSPAMKWKRSVVKAALAKVWGRKNSEWKMEKAYKDQWVRILTNRTMIICRHISQALRTR